MCACVCEKCSDTSSYTYLWVGVPLYSVFLGFFNYLNWFKKNVLAEKKTLLKATDTAYNNTN